jgi:hypothetical protein
VSSPTSLSVIIHTSKQLKNHFHFTSQVQIKLTHNIYILAICWSSPKAQNYSDCVYAFRIDGIEIFDQFVFGIQLINFFFVFQLRIVMEREGYLRSYLSDVYVSRALTLLEDGRSQRGIAFHIGVSQSVISRL